MKLRFAALLLLALLPACRPEPEPPQPAPRPPSGIADFFNTTTFLRPAFFPDGSLLVTANPRGSYDLYRVFASGKLEPLPGDNGLPRLGLAVLPGGRVLFSANLDRSGDRLLVLDPGGTDGRALPVSPVGITAEFLSQSRDRRFFFTGEARRAPGVPDLFEYDAATLEPRLLFANDLDDTFFLGPVSDGRGRIALVKNLGREGERLYLCDLPAGRPRPVKPLSEKPDMITPLFFAGRRLYFIAYGSGDRRSLFMVGDDLAPVAAPPVVGEVRQAALAPNGREAVVVLADEHGDRLARYALEGGWSELPAGGPGRAGEINWAEIPPDGKGLWLLAGADTAPAAIHRLEPATGLVLELVRPAPDLAARYLVVPQPVTVTARDGLALPGLLYRPAGAGRAPALLWLHGGPGGETRRRYDPFLQYMLSRGYVVLALNYRGSAGQGRSFMLADNLRHGREPVRDCLDARDWLAALPWVDPDRIGIVGRSYGGCLTLAALAEAPEKFAAGVDLFGPSNWLSTLASVPAQGRAFLPGIHAEIGNPRTDAARLMEISPISLAGQIRGPLLVVQGAGDERVDKRDTDALVAGIRAANGHVEYVVFINEGHGFGNTRNEMRCFERVREFLDREVKARKLPRTSSP